MKDLQGYFGEDTLQELLHQGEINHLQYVFHHSEEKKNAFLDYCREHQLENDDHAAQRFMEHELALEQADHTDAID